MKQKQPATAKLCRGAKTVLITGCSSGFGKSLVSRFLEQGWRVIATMRRAQERQSLFADAMQRFRDQLIVAELDVTDETERDAIVTLVGQLPDSRLDCLVNNAGYALFGALETCSETQIRQQFEVNLLAPLLLTRKLLPMLRESQGVVINISSLMGFVGFPMSTSYCSSKAGLTMASEALSHELAPFGVRVHSVEPGGFRTGFADNSQWGDTELEAYASITQAFQSFQQRLKSGKGNDPTPVIDRIVNLATKQDTALTHQVGRDARISKLMQKSLPEGLRLRLMGLMFKRVLQ